MRFHSFSIPWDDMIMDHCIIAWVGNWWILMDRMEIFLPKKMHKEMLKPEDVRICSHVNRTSDA